MDTQDTAALVFWYKNYRGEEGYRRVTPISIRFGTSEWHKESQWLMLAHDTVNDKQREFAMRDMSGFVGDQVLPIALAGAGWKVGDWVTYELDIGQIKELREDGTASFTNGATETSGRLVDRFRPLTIRSKIIIEAFQTLYGRLRGIDGEGGFNFPEIHQHFAGLALKAVDGDDDESNGLMDQARMFVSDARDYKPEIQGVPLFRPNGRHR